MGKETMSARVVVSGIGQQVPYSGHCVLMRRSRVETDVHTIETTLHSKRNAVSGGRLLAFNAITEQTLMTSRSESGQRYG